MSINRERIVKALCYSVVALLAFWTGYYRGVADTYLAAEQALCNAEGGMYLVTKTERLCLSRHVVVPARQHLQSSLYL